MALPACRKMMKAVEAAANNYGDNEVLGAFTIADEDAIMTHMMDCVALLAAMQQQEAIPANYTRHSRATRNKVFMAALSVVGESLLNIGRLDKEERPMRTNAAINQVLKAFRVPCFPNPIDVGRDGWLPLHWTVALMSSEQHDVTEADVKALYALDPMAMQAEHVNGILIDSFTPAHLLCMSPVTPISMRLVRSFSVCNPAAFGSTTAYSALHVACRYGTPTIELLQQLLQLDSSQTKVKICLNGSGGEHHPLGQLCYNLVNRDDELQNAEELMNCLLGVDKSNEIVGNALFGCVAGFPYVNTSDEAVADQRGNRLYGLMKALLKVNPEAATHQDSYDENVVHKTCSSSLPSKLCIDVTKLVLALHKDAVRESNADGVLPVHMAAEFCDAEVVEFLLGLFPEAATEITSEEENLLHFAVSEDESSWAVSKVRYLCSRYPAMIQQRKTNGNIPVHVAAVSSRHEVMLALYEAGGAEQFKMPIAHPTEAIYSENGYLPLHLFIQYQFSDLKIVAHAAISEAADTFRWLLRLYPEAAGIEGGVGAANKTTPYQLAVDTKRQNYFLRLLLRAAPTLNPAELHRLNYEERRMAMFLAFRAVTPSIKAPLVARLRGENKDLVQRVVSFL